MKPYVVHVELYDTVAVMAQCVESRRYDGGEVLVALAEPLAGLPASVDALVLDLDHTPGCPVGHGLAAALQDWEATRAVWVVAVAGGRAEIVSIPPEPVPREPVPPEPATPGPVPPGRETPGPVPPGSVPPGSVPPGPVPPGPVPSRLPAVRHDIRGRAAAQRARGISRARRMARRSGGIRA